MVKGKTKERSTRLIVEIIEELQTQLQKLSYA